MYYTEAPWLAPKALSAATSLVWHEVALTGGTAAEFSEQIEALEPFLAKVWQARHSPKTGNPVYERPVALVIYRDDYRFLLDDVVPRQGQARADYDIVIASQPYRARVPVEFKAAKVIAPLVRALRPGGRVLGIHSCGRDPGMEIIRKPWPDPANPPRPRAGPREIAAAAAELFPWGSLGWAAERPEDARLLASLSPGAPRVYFNPLPRRELAHTLPALIALAEAGLEPVPHVAARRVASRAEVEAFLKQAVRLARVRKVLLIGGDVPEPLGPYADGAALMRDGLLSGC